jgi:hypothetical protein
MSNRKIESNSETLACITAEMNLPRAAKSVQTQRLVMSPKKANTLIKAHRLHLGLYRRLADHFGIDASYVSKVAGGTRSCEPVRQRLLKELVVLATMAIK